jgi:hypothetical protein
MNEDLNNSEWEVSFHSDANLNRMDEFAQKFNIDPGHIKNSDFVTGYYIEPSIG